jgi:peptidoglycan/LPS O-acetylase OafA/YrhL
MSPTSPDRIAGLDSIRLLAALYVVLGHGFGLPLETFLPKEGVGRWILALHGNLFPGQAAVIVFFVLSGFCIHWPHAGGRPLHWPGFLVRRLTRIALPLVAAILLASAIGLPIFAFEDSVLWSLIAELVYYALYPLILPVARRTDWMPLLAVAFAAALAINLWRPWALDFPAHGPYLTWLLGLSCWLLGCVLAERVHLGPRLSGRLALWAWRSGLLALMVSCSILKFHGGIGYPWTLPLFAIYAALWLEREIAWQRLRPAPAWLERAGLAAYSLYLTHLLARGVAASLLAAPADPWANLLYSWIAIACLATAFYLLVERPAHRLARRLGWHLLNVLTPTAGSPGSAPARPPAALPVRPRASRPGRG